MARTQAQVGIALEQQNIRCVALQRAHSTPSGASFEAEVTEDSADAYPVLSDEATSAMAAWVKQQRLRGAQAVIGLPIGASVVRPLRLPPLETALIGPAVRAEMDSQMIVPFPDPIYDYRVYPTGHADATYVTVFSAARDRVRHIQTLVRAIGLRPVAVEPRNTGLLRLLVDRRPDSLQDTALLVDIAPGVMEMSVVHRQCVVAARAVALSEASAPTASAAVRDEFPSAFVMESDMAATISQEVARYLSFLQYGAVYGAALTCNLILLCTVFHSPDEWADDMETSSNVPVRAVHLGASTERWLGGTESERFAVACGMALRRGKGR